MPLDHQQHISIFCLKKVYISLYHVTPHEENIFNVIHAYDLKAPRIYLEKAYGGHRLYVPL
jgi:hypothetical protein